MDGQQFKSNLTSPKHWVRLVYMVLFAFFLYIAAFVIGALVVVQFLFSLITGSDNLKLRTFSHSLTVYIQQALMFLTFNSEFKPFPFADWPDAPSPAEPADDTAPAAVVVEPAPVATEGVRTSAPPEPTLNDDAPVEPLDSNKGEKREPPLVDPEAEKKVLS